MLELSITNEQKVLLHVSPRTAAGSAALLDGPVRVEVQSGLSTVEVADGQLKADLTLYPQQRGLSTHADYACTFCRKCRHEVAMIAATVYAATLEVTVRVCSECLAEAGVREVLPEVTA